MISLHKNYISNWKKGLIIVAHPDDELLWCGAFVKSCAFCDWTVLCLSLNSMKHNAFSKSCILIGADPIIAPFFDDSLNFENRIYKTVCDKKYDICITHGLNGEYGHKRHMATHAAVSNLYREKTLIASDLWYFSYAYNGRFSCILGEYVYILNRQEIEWKKKALLDLYGFKSKITPKTESFTSARRIK